MLWKCCTQYASKFVKLSRGHRTGKGQLSFQSKEMQCKEYSSYHTIALISHSSKVMLKIPQARLQYYSNHELPTVQAGFRKGRGIRDQIANIVVSSKKQRSSRKTSTFALFTMPKPLTLWFKEMGMSGHLIFLLRNLYACEEATFRTGHGTTDWFQIGKGVHHSCILSPC